GCPFAPGASGNVCTEDLVHCLWSMEVETGIDLDALISVSKRVEEIVGRALPGQIVKAGKWDRRYPLPDVVQARVAAARRAPTAPHPGPLPKGEREQRRTLSPTGGEGRVRGSVRDDQARGEDAAADGPRGNGVAHSRHRPREGARHQTPPHPARAYS